MSIKLITLNIEGSKHLNTVIPFLKTEKADIICLQEVFKVDFKLIKKELNIDGSFFPMSNRIKITKDYDQAKGVWGLCILSNLKNSVNKFYYVGKGTTPFFTDNWSDDRVLVYGTFEKNKQKYTIGTTHFCFTPDGQADNNQRIAFRKLIKFVTNFGDFILCGDLNTPRGREIYTKFTTYFKDNLPKNIKSTIDP
jgi:mRNA deadenylase 3'-5' endonuclease subunit Ccr4